MGEADYRSGALDRIGEAYLLLRLWYNNMRFPSSRSTETRWYNLGEVSGRRTLKRAAEDFYGACSAIIKRCEAICHQRTFNKP